MNSPLSGGAASPRSLRAARFGQGDNASSRRRSGNGVRWPGGPSERWWYVFALVLLSAAIPALSACGYTGRTVGKERRLDDAIRECAKTHQRVRLIDPSSPSGAQSSYTNIQDSSGQRQTDMSDPTGNGFGWFRCIS